ncbi:hypothetical protein ACU686_22845 [Yinghuangia aomiensis]
MLLGLLDADARAIPAREPRPRRRLPDDTVEAVFDDAVDQCGAALSSSAR